jgi:ABC-2 type transport system ATP-binding protein
VNSSQAVPAVVAADVRKAYGELRAVDGISFTVAPGEFFGIVGPNGAGKTTLIEILEGLRRPDSGEVEVLGQRPSPRNRALLPLVGVQMQSSAFFVRLTALEHLRTVAALYGVGHRRADEVLEMAGLSGAAGTRIDKLSGGQRQRLAIAGALTHDPRLLFLDEPTAAVDPRPSLAVAAAAPAQGRRQDHHLHHAPHGRGGGALRPGRDR